MPNRTKPRNGGRVGRVEGHSTAGWRTLLGVLAALGTIGAWLAPAALGADTIYWGGGSSNAVRFGNLDGTGPTQSLFTGESQAGGVAIDPAAGKIYWADYGGPGIRVGNLDGTGGQDVFPPPSTQATPVAVSIDPAAGKLYWLNYNGSEPWVANLDGTGAHNLFPPQTSGVADFAIDPAGGKIYWTADSPNAIVVANLDGTGMPHTLYSGASVTNPNGIAIDAAAGKIYWTNYTSSGQIEVANLDGNGTAATLYSTEYFPGGLALDPSAGKIYWTAGSAIRVGNLNGNGLPQNVFAGESAPDRPALLRSPEGTGAPQVSGGSTAGSPLSCSQGSWAPDLEGAFLYRAPQSFAYQWTLNGVDISGANGSSYTPASGGTYSCRVSASNFAGATAQTSGSHADQGPPACQPLSVTTKAGRALTISLGCTDSTGAPVTYALDSNPSHGSLGGFNASTGQVTYTPASGYAGTDSFTYHATSANGTAPPQAVSIAVTPVSIIPSRPTITSVSMSNKRFRVAAKATAISARKAPRGTSFRFILSASARVQIAITRSAQGLRKGRRCVAPTGRLKRAHAKRCNRTVTVGTLTRANLPAGSDSVPFSGRIGRRALAPGPYHVVLLAINGGGSSSPAKLQFSVVG